LGSAPVPNTCVRRRRLSHNRTGAIVADCVDIFGDHAAQLFPADAFAWTCSRRAGTSFFQSAAELDRDIEQHGEESLKQKIGAQPGITMVCAAMPALAIENWRSWPH
jgi:hypothetical protein